MGGGGVPMIGYSITPKCAGHFQSRFLTRRVVMGFHSMADPEVYDRGFLRLAKVVS